MAVHKFRSRTIHLESDGVAKATSANSLTGHVRVLRIGALRQAPARLLAFQDRVIRFTAEVEPPNLTWSCAMRLISSLIVCLGLSTCATDYVSQLYPLAP